MDPTEDTKTDLSDQRIDTIEITEVGTLEPHPHPQTHPKKVQ